MDKHWYQAIFLKPSGTEVKDLIAKEKPIIIDTLNQQLEEYARIIQLGKPNPKNTKELFPNPEELSTWVYYPWKNTLVKVVQEDYFKKIRTSRNRLKITEKEQALFENATVGVVGLSVGNAIAVTIAMERSAGTLVLADFDTLELSNMNRLKTSLCDLGLSKSIITARQIAEIDPFIKVILYQEGITSQNMNAFLSENGNLDVLVEVCDGLKLKLELREEAKKKGIPVLMDTNDRGMFDVERFDLEPDRPILHGKLEQLELNSLDLSKMEDVLHVVKQIVPVETMSKRLKDSMKEVGKTVISWPQLAGDVMLGSAGIAYLSRAVLSKKAVPSGRYFVDFEELFSIENNV